MRTLIVKTGNQKKMLMCWEEIYYQITDPKSKPLEIKTSTFFMSSIF